MLWLIPHGQRRGVVDVAVCFSAGLVLLTLLCVSQQGWFCDLMASSTLQPQHIIVHREPGMGALILHDCRGRSTAARGSLRNAHEAAAAATLLRRLLRAGNPGSIAVLTPYRAQLQVLRSECARVLEAGDASVEFSTIDGFQGREADVVLFSCVRCVLFFGRCTHVTSICCLFNHRAHAAQQTLGFLADARRVNVALTRARQTLWVLGNVATLERSAVWKVRGMPSQIDSHLCGGRRLWITARNEAAAFRVVLKGDCDRHNFLPDTLQVQTRVGSFVYCV